MANPNGHPASLRPPEQGNMRRLVHGVYSQRIRDERTAEVLERWRDVPHLSDLDELAVTELARVEALIELLDAEIAARGVTNGRGQARTIVELRLRASSRHSAILESLGLTPRERSKWAARLGGGGVAAEIKRRLAEIEQAERS